MKQKIGAKGRERVGRRTTEDDRARDASRERDVRPGIEHRAAENAKCGRDRNTAELSPGTKVRFEREFHTNQ